MSDKMVLRLFSFRTLTVVM